MKRIVIGGHRLLAKSSFRAFCQAPPEKRHFLLRYTLSADKLSALASQAQQLRDEFQTRTEEFENKRHILFGGRVTEAETETYVFLFESENEVMPYDFIKDVG